MPIPDDLAFEQVRGAWAINTKTENRQRPHPRGAGRVRTVVVTSVKLVTLADEY